MKHAKPAVLLVGLQMWQRTRTQTISGSAVSSCTAAFEDHFSPSGKQDHVFESRVYLLQGCQFGLTQR